MESRLFDPPPLVSRRALTRGGSKSPDLGSPHKNNLENPKNFRPAASRRAELSLRSDVPLTRRGGVKEAGLHYHGRILGGLEILKKAVIFLFPTAVNFKVAVREA